MRCPYCGGLNQERAAFCVNCGRDMTRQMPNVPAQRQQSSQASSPPQTRHFNTPNQPAQRVNQPAQRPANQPVASPTPQGQAPAPTSRRNPGTASPIQAPAAPLQPAPPPAPEPPAPFPPRTIAQFDALLTSGAQQYTVVESRVGDGKKKIVRIAYPRCAGWQQAATLFLALKEQQEDKFNTIIIQGVLPQQPDVYAFTNGQLQFDRAVRLGGQIGNRCVVETENGFASDSVRFVLNE